MAEWPSSRVSESLERIFMHDTVFLFLAAARVVLVATKMVTSLFNFARTGPGVLGYGRRSDRRRPRRCAGVPVLANE